jgi:hypothetical protein
VLLQREFEPGSLFSRLSFHNDRWSGGTRDHVRCKNFYFIGFVHEILYCWCDGFPVRIPYEEMSNGSVTTVGGGCGFGGGIGAGCKRG